MSKLGLMSLILFIFGLGIKAQTKTIELPMGSRGMMPTVEVMVNGQGPFVFAIDTGAGGKARADSSLVTKLGLKKIGEAQGGDSSGRTRAMDVVQFDSLKVGEIEFKNVEAPSRNYNTAPDLPKIDGILGFNLFTEYLLTLDYPAKKVRLEKGDLPNANGQEILSFENPNGVPIVEIEVGKQKVKAHIDSGNLVGSFILPTEIVEKASLANEPSVVGRARTVSSEVEIKRVQLKDSIRFGSFEFADPIVDFPALSVGNIGSRILKEFSLTFDQKNKRVKLNRTSQSTATTAITATTEKTKVDDYTGQYGDRTISIEEGSLFIQRPNGRKLKMVEVSKDEFTLELVPAAKIKFIRNESGKVTEINVLNQEGVWEKVKKG